MGPSWSLQPIITQLLFLLWKIIRHGADCCHNKGKPSGAIRLFTTKSRQQCATLFIMRLHQKYRENSISVVSFFTLRTETVVQWIRFGIDSVDARRPGCIDLIIKTTSNSRQTKINYLHSSNEENSQSKRADLDGNFFGGSAVTVKWLKKLALYKYLYKVCLCGQKKNCIRTC